jgi:hypothetical protein
MAFIKEKIIVGDPAQRGTIVGPMINAAAREKIVSWVNDATRVGASLLTPLQIEGSSVLGPLLLENVPSECSVWSDEVFAPLAVLQPYSDYPDALKLVNASRFGLQAGVFTNNLQKALLAFEELEVGGVLINQVPTFRTENMPYGGIKDSGTGREGIRYAMEEMTELRSFVVNCR